MVQLLLLRLEGEFVFRIGTSGIPLLGIRARHVLTIGSSQFSFLTTTVFATGQPSTTTITALPETITQTYVLPLSHSLHWSS